MRRCLKELIPPIISRAYHDFARGTITFRGDYPSWEAARAESSGYNSEEIFRKTLDAALKVKHGEAAFERDSVVFDRVEFSFPVLAALLRVACMRGGDLSVLDFGGSLGCSYRQFKAFHIRLRSLRWKVVEQARLVECGRQFFQDTELRFYAGIAEAVHGNPPDVVLLSSVLQYVEDPYALIERIESLGNVHIILDRTPCAGTDRDLLTVQNVPSSIYKASYPCWIFSRNKLLSAFADRHSVLASFRELSTPWKCDRGEFFLEGFIFDRQK